MTPALACAAAKSLEPIAAAIPTMKTKMRRLEAGRNAAAAPDSREHFAAPIAADAPKPPVLRCAARTAPPARLRHRRCHRRASIRAVYGPSPGSRSPSNPQQHFQRQAKQGAHEQTWHPPFVPDDIRYTPVSKQSCALSAVRKPSGEPANAPPSPQKNASPPRRQGGLLVSTHWLAMTWGHARPFHHHIRDGPPLDPQSFHARYESFSPTIPARIRTMHAMRTVVAGSL